MAPTDLRIVYDSSAFDIHEGANVIGRKDADITIPVASLSKEHARIIRDGSRLEIEDAGSKNGTMLNDMPVEGRMLLEPGDVIVLGGKVQLQVVSGDQPIPAASGAAPGAPPRSSAKIPLDDSKRSADAPPRRDAAAIAAAPGTPPPPKARFTVIMGDGKGKVVELVADKQFTLGTKEENALPLKGEGISRYHAEVVFEKGVWLLKDLGSRNGTLVRDRKVDLHELVAGDVVQIGSAHLRFDVEEVRASVDARGLVELLKKDPKAALKTPEMRRAGMLVMAAAAIGLYLLSQRTPPPPPPPPPPENIAAIVHETIDFLRKDDAIRARDHVQKAIRALGYHTNATLTALDQVVKKWQDHKSPISFEWKAAVETIDAVIHASTASDMDPDCTEWLQKQRTDALAEIPNAELRTQADIAMTRGQNDLRAGKKEGADELKEARDSFKKMPPSSVFAANARERAEQIRQDLLKHYKREAETIITGEKPKWDEALRILDEARKYTESLDERRPIDERKNYCTLNLNDEDTLIEVTKIVQTSDEAKYAHAKELLDSIATTSKCYPNAQAYMSWFKADGLARKAVSAYNSGDLENATRLLNQALNQPGLEPPAIESGKNLLIRWTRVEEDWRKGYEAEQKSDFVTAKERYRNLLENEQVPKNYFRDHAEEALKRLEAREQEDLDTALKRGIELLDAGKYDDAYAKFCNVLQNAPNPGPPRNQIEDAVARANHEKGLFKNAERLYVQNKKDKFPYVREVLQLLGRFLPEKDPDREPAIELIKKVKG